jgi:hypothetical protein
MKKEEFIRRYGRTAYAKRCNQTEKWGLSHQKELRAAARERGRNGGKYYEQCRKYKITGLQGVRNKIRGYHNRRWAKYKKFVAHGSQLHHQWAPGSPRYKGVALVEADQHRHGIIDVIRILEGKITMFTEG